MDGIANLATSMAQTSTNAQKDVALLKKAIDIEANGALALLTALPAPMPTPTLPPHLGQNVNTKA